MAFSPENLKIWVDSREYSRQIQMATYPPFTKGTKGRQSNTVQRVRGGHAVFVPQGAHGVLDASVDRKVTVGAVNCRLKELRHLQGMHTHV